MRAGCRAARNAWQCGKLTRWCSRWGQRAMCACRAAPHSPARHAHRAAGARAAAGVNIVCRISAQRSPSFHHPLCLASRSKVRPSLLARQPKSRLGSGGGRAPYGSAPVTTSDQRFANGVADLLTAPGAGEALKITGVPPEWEVRLTPACALRKRGLWPVRHPWCALRPAPPRTCFSSQRAACLPALGNAVWEQPAAAAATLCRPRNHAQSCAMTPKRWA